MKDEKLLELEKELKCLKEKPSNERFTQNAKEDVLTAVQEKYRSLKKLITDEKLDKFSERAFNIHLATGKEVYIHLIKNHCGEVIEMHLIKSDDLIKIPKNKN